MEISFHIIECVCFQKCETHRDNHNISSKKSILIIFRIHFYLFFLYVTFKGSSRAHMEAVERIPGQILLPSIPADC